MLTEVVAVHLARQSEKIIRKKTQETRPREGNDFESLKSKLKCHVLLLKTQFALFLNRDFFKESVKIPLMSFVCRPVLWPGWLTGLSRLSH